MTTAVVISCSAGPGPGRHGRPGPKFGPRSATMIAGPSTGLMVEKLVTRSIDSEESERQFLQLEPWRKKRLRSTEVVSTICFSLRHPRMNAGCSFR
jgi:hypothetical protein